MEARTPTSRPFHLFKLLPNDARMTVLVMYGFPSFCGSLPAWNTGNALTERGWTAMSWTS